MDAIPGTTIFDSTQARKGYALNRMCFSFNSPVNRAAFVADEEGYCRQFDLNAEQRRAVKDRDVLAMIAAGGNIYYLAKLGATDGHSFQYLAAEMTGLTQEQYAQMMLKGGRNIEGNRSKAEWAKKNG